MKKILLINNGYPDKVNKNNCTYIKSIYECLIAGNNEVNVLSLKKLNNKVVSYLFFYHDILKVDFNKYDNIYINHWPYMFLPMIFKKLNEKNVIINFHGSDLMAESRIKKMLNNISYKFIPKNAEFVVPSKYFESELKKKINGKIHIVPSGGVDTKLFNNNNKNNNKEKIIFGFASGLNEGKGIDLVLNAFRELKEANLIENVELKVIDYGNQSISFKEKVNYYKLDKVITFEKVYEKDKMNEFYNKIDCLLFPTIRKAESLGLVALEAIACGVFIIGTNGFAIPEYVRDGVNGYLFNKGDLDDFIEKLKLVINNNYEEELCKKFSYDIIKQNYSKERCIEIFNQILN